MALIKSIKRIRREENRVHHPIDCTAEVFEKDGRRYLQLDTHGSGDRQLKGKVSQTIQIDDRIARLLIDLLEEVAGYR